MSCPTCGRTMQSIGLDNPAHRTWWCSGCGTLKEYNGEFFRIELPANLRHVILAAEIKPGVRHTSQFMSIDAVFKIEQKDEEPPRIEQQIFRGSKRLF